MIKIHVYAVLAVIVLVAVCLTPANAACVEEVEEETIMDDKTLFMAIEAQLEKADVEIDSTTPVVCQTTKTEAMPNKTLLLSIEFLLEKAKIEIANQNLESANNLLKQALDNGSA